VNSKECLALALSTDPSKACPSCQQPVDEKDVITRDSKLIRVKKEEQPEIDMRDPRLMESSKLQALLDQLRYIILNHITVTYHNHTISVTFVIAETQMCGLA
jgi:Fe-S cluster assembly iron-binding protein IscA